MKNFTKFIAVALAAAAITISAGSHSVSAAVNDVVVDSVFLQNIGVSPNSWPDYYTIFNWKEVSNDVDAAWARAGVRSVSRTFGENDYYIDGKKVTREEAFKHALSRSGKTVDIKRYFPPESNKVPVHRS